MEGDVVRNGDSGVCWVRDDFYSRKRHPIHQLQANVQVARRDNWHALYIKEYSRHRQVRVLFVAW